MTIPITRSSAARLMALSADSTVDLWLLADEEELLKMLGDGADYEACLAWINENF